jgi:hypothetical protein
VQHVKLAQQQAEALWVHGQVLLLLSNVQASAAAAAALFAAVRGPLPY